jgi:hypothetical protein
MYVNLNTNIVPPPFLKPLPLLLTAPPPEVTSEHTKLNQKQFNTQARRTLVNVHLIVGHLELNTLRVWSKGDLMVTLVTET